MDLAPQILTAKVMHRRTHPAQNSFTYGVYYLVLPLPAPKIPSKLVSFHPADLGRRDGSDPGQWARNILKKHNLEQYGQNMMLVTMPRVLGYIFNPVSFYICFDSVGKLRVVIAEVHNTFGEQHSYICTHPGAAVISEDDWLEAKKIFHVSPFLERAGHYRFRFALSKGSAGIWIDYYDAQKNKQLLTSLTGTLEPLSSKSISKVFWTYPLLTLKAIMLIHFQAIKLFFKGGKYSPKPKQHSKRVSSTDRSSKSR